MAQKQFQFGFIGMGNMGYAILMGLLKTWSPDQITYTKRTKNRADEISAQTKVLRSETNASCAASSRFVVLAVKPQQMNAVIADIRDVITEDQIIISVAAGISIADLTERIGRPCRIVRAMPNTPALVGEGMTGR